jgi:hypothetical protein
LAVGMVTVGGQLLDSAGAPKVSSRVAKAIKILRFSMPARLYLYDTLLERLPQDLEDMAVELWRFIQADHPMVRQRHVTRQRHVAPGDPPRIRDGVLGARHGRVVTKVVRSPVRPATLWMRVVSMASARVIAGRMVVSRCASMDVPVLGGARRKGLWAEHPYSILTVIKTRSSS